MSKDADGEIPHWLSEARAGSNDALGRALDACRRYLLLIANQQLDPELQAKGGASDLVQLTFLEAQRDFVAFHGDSDEQLRAWLRRLLLNNVADFVRHYRGTDKRKLDREASLTFASGSQGTVDLAGPARTPSGEFMEQERLAQLQQAIARLPDDYRRVIVYRNQEDRSFDEIARLLDRSENAVRKLWFRAVEQLRQELDGM